MKEMRCHTPCEEGTQLASWTGQGDVLAACAGIGALVPKYFEALSIVHDRTIKRVHIKVCVTPSI